MSDAAIATVATCVVTITTMIVGFLTLWVKLRYGVEKTVEANEKIEHNTDITKKASAVAVINAKEAADTAKSAKEATEQMAMKLNGKLDDKITETVKAHIAPIADALLAHIKQDEDNMEEIRKSFDELKKHIEDNK